jgi:hypothetical protein
VKDRYEMTNVTLSEPKNKAAEVAVPLPFGALNRRRQLRLRGGLLRFMKGTDSALVAFAVRVVKSKRSRRVPTVVPRTRTPRVGEFPRAASAS